MKTQATLVMDSDKRERVDAIPIDGTPMLLHVNADGGAGFGYRATLKGTGLCIPYVWGNAIACYYDIQKWYMVLPKDIRPLYESKRPNMTKIRKMTPRNGLEELKKAAERSHE